MRNFLCITLLPFFLSAFAIGEEHVLRTADLTKQKSSWLSVCGGGAVSSPVPTEYGFAVYNDGRMVCAFSHEGTVLWQKPVRGKQTPYISSFGDFLYAISASKNLNLINPSGLTLWTTDLGFTPVESPLAGYDGRVFVRGKNTLSCYGINGIRKWSISTAEASKIPLLAFNDGTILAISSQLKNGKSTAIRVSPFGEILEGITFSGKIIAASSSPHGILLSQEDETIGLCRIEDGVAVSAWVANSLTRKNFTAVCPSRDGSQAAFIAQNGKAAEIVIVESLTGKEKNRFLTDAFKTASLSYIRATDAGFVLADEEHALECSADGTIIWSAKLPKKSKWSHLFYTTKNALVICDKDWSLKGYVMNQSVEKKGTKRTAEELSYLPPQRGTGMTAGGLNFERLSMELMQQISVSFDSGNYGIDEKGWLYALKKEAQTFIDDHVSLVRSSHDGLSYFAANPVYAQSLLMLLSKTGTTSFVHEFADLLTLETDPALLSFVIQYAGKEAYDKNGEILKAFETLLTRRLTPRESSTLKGLCDATYEICRFMGKPALNKKGKDVLTYLFYPQFDKGTREYARQTLSRIMELEL